MSPQVPSSSGAQAPRGPPLTDPLIRSSRGAWSRNRCGSREVHRSPGSSTWSSTEMMSGRSMRWINTPFLIGRQRGTVPLVDELTRAPASRTTRELLLDTAERIFAQKGTRAVALREIGVAANQRNNGVAQYHFGSKEGL